MVERAKENLERAVILIVEDRLADIWRGLPEDAVQDRIVI
jgi:protein-L-isoaspartate O-methyltransferase